MNRRAARPASLLLALAAAALPAAAWPHQVAQPEPAGSKLLPQSALGAAARDFIAMINDGSPSASASFEAAHRSPAQRAKVPAADRAARAASMHKEFGTLRIQELLASDAASLTVLTRDAAGRFITMEFISDPAAGNKLEGVILDISSDAKRPEPLTAEARAAAVNAACTALEESYVYPDVARKMAASVRQKLKAGEYDSITLDSALARRLTGDFRAISKDGHLRVNAAPKPPSEAAVRQMPTDDEMARQNYAFKKVEILPGNIGLLRFDLFADSDGARKTAAAAMAFLANADALIIDLRSNGGGSPEMIRFLTSYFFDSPTHLNDMIDREGKVVEEFWTLEEIPGRRFPKDLPIFILTSGATFSGAEEFSYNLKNLKRATIIGQTTGGGAHPVRGVRISDRFTLGIPYMRANNPITKTNWEGTGVSPHIEVPLEEALDRALTEAAAAIASRKPN